MIEEAFLLLYHDTFSLESPVLLEDARSVLLGLYDLLSVTLCLAGVWQENALDGSPNYTKYTKNYRPQQAAQAVGGDGLFILSVRTVPLL